LLLLEKHIDCIHCLLECSHYNEYAYHFQVLEMISATFITSDPSIVLAHACLI
jgi:hypothetical protein